MQTFVPRPDFAASAACLDRQRLGKQRVETLQILKALLTGSGWVNHPATKMWRGHELALMEYQAATVAEWTRRGYKDTCLEKSLQLVADHLTDGMSRDLPPWWGDERVHRSHRANLLRKLPEHYGPLFESDLEPMDGYYWPVSS